jgi:hypothetical protein
MEKLRDGSENFSLRSFAGTGSAKQQKGFQLHKTFSEIYRE